MTIGACNTTVQRNSVIFGGCAAARKVKNKRHALWNKRRKRKIISRIEKKNDTLFMTPSVCVSVLLNIQYEDHKNDL